MNGIPADIRRQRELRGIKLRRQPRHVSGQQIQLAIRFSLHRPGRGRKAQHSRVRRAFNVQRERQRSELRHFQLSRSKTILPFLRIQMQAEFAATGRGRQINLTTGIQPFDVQGNVGFRQCGQA